MNALYHGNDPHFLRHCIKTILASYVCLSAFVSIVGAQQPFVTDNSDVTDTGKFHLEIASEFDRLQPTSLPLKYQNNSHLTIAYGLVKNVEVSVTGQYLGIVSNTSPRTVSGISDTTIAIKYNFYKEDEDSLLPALTVSALVQFPTGNSSRGLGSGVIDVGINGIAQKTFREKNVFRLNGGVLFSGNTLTGAIGFTVVRGQVFTGGASYVRKITETLQLGGEITGAVPNNFQLSQGQLQSQFGGNYKLGKNTSFDFGFIIGRFAASPRVGVQIGLSHDF